MELGELPAGWEAAELSEICRINPTIDKSAIADDLAVSFVPMPAVEPNSGAINVSATRKFGEVKKGYTPFQEGDVLFAKITPCMENGKMAVVPALTNGLGFGSTEFHVLRTHAGISPQFIYYFVSSKAFRHTAEHNMSGAVGQRRVTTPYLSACKIPVPPTAEQHRIVAKIEELFSELDQGVASLKTAREQLKVYRQALLKHAFAGKLTAAWRAAHRDQLKTATALQQRIQIERQERHHQQLANWEAKGKQGSKPKAPKPLPPLTAEELAELPELPELPEGWGWIKLGAANVEVFDGPFGSNLKSSDYVPDGVRVIRLENIGAMEFIEAKLSFITLEKYLALEKHTVLPGDLVFSSFVTESVRVAMVPPSIEKAVNKADCFCVRLFGETLLNSYALMFLATRSVFKRLEDAIHGVGRPRINTTQLKNVVIPVCCIEEQRQLVALVQEKLSEADQLDQTLTTALQQSAALRQSILKKAFCGQLVKQDKNDEPASVLLERIRAEMGRAKEGLGGRGKGKVPVGAKFASTDNDSGIPNTSIACGEE